jgi:hypothetical protein
MLYAPNVISAFGSTSTSLENTFCFICNCMRKLKCIYTCAWMHMCTRTIATCAQNRCLSTSRYSIVHDFQQSYHNKHLLPGFMFELTGHWNACANGAKFTSAPFTRYLGGECGSVKTSILAYAGRVTEHLFFFKKKGWHD